MTDHGPSGVQQHAPALLNYAVWARMGGRQPVPLPPALAEGFQQWQGLAPEARADVDAYAERCWRFVCDEAMAAACRAQPVRETQAALRQQLPHLDDWTAGVLWNCAYRLAMQ